MAWSNAQQDAEIIKLQKRCKSLEDRVLLLEIFGKRVAVATAVPLTEGDTAQPSKEQ